MRERDPIGAWLRSYALPSAASGRGRLRVRRDRGRTR